MFNKRYWKGNIPCTWDDSFKHLEYQYLYPESHRIMVKQWTEQGYSSDLTLNGAVHFLQNRLPAYILPLCNQLAWHDIGCQLYCMRQADILPVHQDHYSVYKKIVKITDPGKIWRAVVFLEDWKSGHYFEMNGEPWVQWRAGDYMVWNNDVPHMAANLGVEPRYTLQLTGWM